MDERENGQRLRGSLDYIFFSFGGGYDDEAAAGSGNDLLVEDLSPPVKHDSAPTLVDVTQPNGAASRQGYIVQSFGSRVRVIYRDAGRTMTEEVERSRIVQKEISLSTSTSGKAPERAKKVFSKPRVSTCGSWSHTGASKSV